PKVAHVLSKIDTMQLLRRVKGAQWATIMSNTGPRIRRDPGLHTRGSARLPGNLLHCKAQSRLSRLGAQGRVTTITRPHTGRALPYRFFAVSALGEAAEGERIHKRGIASFRCLDPVRWVLDAHGVI